MSLFFETIKVIDGEIQNLHYHNQRLNQTIQKVFHKKSNIDLHEHIIQKDFTKQRCKVIYDTSIKKIQFFPLVARTFQSFKFLETNITYNFKSVDREEIDALFLQKGSCDEILLVKEGLVRDTSIANIAIYDGQAWITPKSPLLKGTYRESLLEKQLLLEKDVKIKDIKNAQGIALMNALIGFYVVKGAKFEY